MELEFTRVAVLLKDNMDPHSGTSIVLGVIQQYLVLDPR